ncbi:hypothetical protein [Actinoplanes sp. NPDC020271]|uniref:hypothetical protein n=1 Tax=Actinoplanes sp. NPDC020271 TaxID=3363896 RepID=UPI00379C6F91
MPTLLQRLREFLRSPRGKQLIERGRQELAEPENQQRARRLLGKLRDGRKPQP